MLLNSNVKPFLSQYLLKLALNKKELRYTWISWNLSCHLHYILRDKDIVKYLNNELVNLMIRNCQRRFIGYLITHESVKNYINITSLYLTIRKRPEDILDILYHKNVYIHVDYKIRREFKLKKIIK